jgi:ABC-type phosphate transport system substrate-binding protein
MKRRTPLAVLGLVLLAPLAGRAGEIIANPTITLNASEVRDVFLGDKQFAGQTKLVPVDNASAQAEFAAKVLQIEITRYTSVWTKKAFREGLNAPALKGSDAEVIAFVKATPGAIGYVGVAPAGMRVLSKY